MEDTLSINSTDLRLLGFKLREPRGVWDLPQYAKDSTSIPGKSGQVVPQPSTVRVSSRTLEVIGTLMGSSRADFLTKLDQLKALVTKVPLTVILAEQPTRFYTARPLGMGMTPIGPVLIQRQQEFTIQLICDDPLAYDVTPTTVAFTGATATPLGTASSGGIITVTGAASPTITYKNSAGATVQTMVFAGVSGTLTIDLDKFLITDGGGNAVSKLTGGSFIELSPLDGNFLTSAWPTLAVSAGSGSITYRKAWT